MQVTRSNYEAVLIDYLDGKLDPLEVAELLLFLEQNSDLKTEFEGIENLNFMPDAAAVYPQKEQLKKAGEMAQAVNDETRLLIIGKIEKQLSPAEEAQLENLMRQNKILESELARFKQTILKADTELVFAQKEQLKRRTKLIPIWAYYVSAAAVFLLLFALPFLIRDVQKNTATLGLNLKNQVPKNSNFFSNKKVQKNAASFIKNSEGKNINSERMSQPKPVQNTNAMYVQEGEIKPEKSIDLKQDTLVEMASNQDLTALKDSSLKVEALEQIVTSPQAYLSLKSLVQKKIKDLSKSNLEEASSAEVFKPSDKISFWDFASIGARVISKASGKKLKLKNRYNEAGELRQYAIVGDKFEFSRSR